MIPSRTQHLVGCYQRSQRMQYWDRRQLVNLIKRSPRRDCHWHDGLIIMMPVSFKLRFNFDYLYYLKFLTRIQVYLKTVFFPAERKAMPEGARHIPIAQAINIASAAHVLGASMNVQMAPHDLTDFNQISHQTLCTQPVFLASSAANVRYSRLAQEFVLVRSMNL